MKTAIIALALSVSSFAVNASVDVQKEKFIQCTVAMTNEETAEIVTKSLELAPAMFANGPYHEEDDQGSTTIYYDAKSKRGSVTVMDTEKVTFTGVINCL
ncbi:hypothetical protein VWH18_06060 [Escherichia coli O157]|uniref:Uncharacterized protein n=1 Tax=Escherichia phage 121Q TaxID=1555202 RepID=A0A097EXN9_9CAUD|nr:hypothetical protein PBI_121Q_276 [Escherichia phage 121Q]AIT14166.1 hypothetical protein PBI_121Q_276 [Escherichia phage 121Q]MED6573017.1 hypothetical protein [Escherichia coli O157]